MPDELKRRIIELRGLEWSYSQIQKATGASLGTISKVLSQNQNPRPPEGKAGAEMLNHADDSTARRGANPEDGGPK